MEEKRNFISAVAGMFKGIVKPREYVENGRKSTWLSATLIIFAVSIILPLFTLFLPLNNGYGEGRLADELDEQLPEFVLTEQGLSCTGQNTWYENTKLYFSIDTDVNRVDDDIIRELIPAVGYDSAYYYDIVVIVARKNIFLYSKDYNNGEHKYVEWSDIYKRLQDAYGAGTYSKSGLVSMIRKWDTPFIVVSYVVLVIFTFVAYYIAILLWGMFGSIVCSIKNVGLSYGELCRMAVYVRTPWYIIRKLINSYIYDGGLFFWILMFAVIAVYICAAIYIYAKRQKDNLNNSELDMYNVYQ